MKIVCDACQAKYSISDDKVQGKVFKIRCKKCSNIIVVRGGGGAAEPAPPPQQEKDTRVYDYGYDGGDHAPAGDESVWHVVINQDQVGPMTAVEVQKRFASGEIDGETYIWREGFADWLPLTQVDTFASLASSGGAAAPARSGRASEGVASMFGGNDEASTARNDPADLFASAAGAAGDDDGGDLFGSKPAAQSNQAGSKLRGERNENSVLFSLNNLAQLASDKPAPAPRPAAAAASAPVSAGAATGSSGGEGSGLIDIRSMASAYLGGGGGGPAKPATAGVGSIDDLPVFGGGGFSEPAVIVPMASRGNNNKLMYALIASVGLLAVAAVVVVLIMLKSGDKPQQVAQTDPKEAKTEPAAAAPSGETKPAETKPAETKPADTAVAPPPPPTDTKPADTAPAHDNRVAAAEPARTPTTTTHRTAPTPTPAAPPTPRAPKPEKVAATPPPAKEPPPTKSNSGGDSGGCDEVSCVLNNYQGACCAKFAKGKGGGGGGGGGNRSGGSDLPESLDRAMISDGVGKVKVKVMSCGEKSSAKGQVKVSVKVGPDGHVSNVTVKNTPDAKLGDCVANMMQKATFPKTQTGGSFSYPYTF